MVAQARGGALMRGGTPESLSKGGRVAAERRRARAERNEEIEDAVVGHVEKLSTIIGHLVVEARGEQYRCPECGCFGPKVPKLGLKDAADVLRLLKAAIARPGEAATVVPIQVIVAAGGPVVPYSREQGR